MALKECQDKLLDEDIVNVSNYIEVGERGLAFDTLCSQLYEYDARLTGRVMALLAEIGQILQADPELWEVLETEEKS